MKILSILIAVISAVIVFALPFNLSLEAKVVVSITIFAAILWFTEALPLWVTALSIPSLLVIFTTITPSKAFSPFFDPIIALLLGGFILGRAVQKHGLAQRMAYYLTSLFGRNSNSFLLSLMIATAFLSFWISNSAAAALMMPIGIAAITASRFKTGSNYSKALVLGIGYAATIGGVGTLIGTPPNLIAVRWLDSVGIIQINFIDWMMRAVPLVAIMIPLTWFVLTKLYKPEVAKVKIASSKTTSLDRQQMFVIGIFALTVFLWLTEPLHGIHNSVVAMVPIISLYALKLLDKNDVGKIGWDILILVGGGLVLGSAINSSGLDVVIANNLASILSGKNVFLLFLGLSVFSIAFTTFVANTATAAILIPIMIPLAQLLGVSPVAIALLIGIVVSFDFVVPVGTPPNAIAYGTGYIRVKDMVKAGLLLSIIGAVTVSLFALFW